MQRIYSEIQSTVNWTSPIRVYCTMYVQVSKNEKKEKEKKRCLNVRLTLISGNCRTSGKALMQLEWAASVCKRWQLRMVVGTAFSRLPLRSSSSSCSSRASLLQRVEAWLHESSFQQSKLIKLVSFRKMTVALQLKQLIKTVKCELIKLGRASELKVVVQH